MIASSPHQEAAQHCALQAAEALALFLDRSVRSEPPHGYRLAVDALDDGMLAPAERVAAVFADLEGTAQGVAGIVLCEALVADLLARLLGTVPAKKLEDRARSALLEAGNIAISAASGSLARVHGGRVLPSVPRLAYDLSGATLRTLVPPGGEGVAYLAETGFRDARESLPLRFVWIPQD